MSEVKLKRANTKKSICSYLPKNLKDIIKDEKKIKYKDKFLKTAYLIDIIHSFNQKYRVDKKISFNYSSLILKEKYGYYYNLYMEFLVKHDIIRVLSNHLAGKKCKTYILMEDSRQNIEFYYNTDKVLLRKYKEKYTEKHIKKLNYKYINKPVMDKLLEYLDMVDIDFNEAQIDVGKLCTKQTQYDKNLHSILSLKEHDIWYKFDSYGRFHNNLTTLKGELRKGYLTIEGEYTKEIDLSNSQPIFLSKLLSENIDEVDIDEYNMFKELVIKGLFYEYVSDLSGITKRKDIKSMVYTVFFGNNKFKSKKNKLFKKMFPSIFEFIKLYKASKGNNKSLAYELQRSESNWLFNNVLEEFISIYPNVPFFTVHDSIAVKKSDFPKMEKIFNKHMEQLHSGLNVKSKQTA